MAHRLAWRKALCADGDAAFIFEDDVVLCSDFRQRLEQLDLPDDWQVIYFGCVMLDKPETVRPGLLRVRGRTWDMHAYMIRRPLAHQVSRLLREPSSRLPSRSILLPKPDTACDVILARMHNEVPAYTVWPPMAWQRTCLSNNENCVRGNYRPDGRQIPYAHIAAELDRLHGIPPGGSGISKPKSE